MVTSAPIPTSTWPPAVDFRDRDADLAAMERWWAGPTRDALCLYGRRRVGKSWLFRRFAVGKPAVIFVADRTVLPLQLSRFAAELEPVLGVRPAIAGLAELFRLLYRLGETRPVLAIIDEFPSLLPDGQQRVAALTELQAMMEEGRDRSQTKLVLCGSLIGQMTSLLAADSPLHGRLQPLDVQPMTPDEALTILPHGSAVDFVERYGVAGGMARYLIEFADARPLSALICERVLDRRAPLFNDPLAVLQLELQSPVHFSILEQLAVHEAAVEHLRDALQMPSGQLTPYLDTLRDMRLISSSVPVGAGATARGRRYRIDDGFIRFWFRFVFPNQDSLDTGLRPEDLWESTIAQHLGEHVAATFEDLCLRSTRRQHGHVAPTVGRWWGNALNAERRRGARAQEEIDVVGALERRLTVVGECKWTNAPMEASTLHDLRTYKVPALLQEGRLTLGVSPPDVLLFAKSGFSETLQQLAQADQHLHLIDADAVLASLR